MNKNICHLCYGTGIYIDKSINNSPTITLLLNPCSSFCMCKYCNGTGYLDSNDSQKVLKKLSAMAKIFNYGQTCRNID